MSTDLQTSRQKVETSAAVGRFSVFKNIGDKKPIARTLSRLIDDIRKPEGLIYRNTDDLTLGLIEKSALPAATISALCEGGHGGENFVSHSGLICLDIDGKDNGFFDVVEKRKALQKDFFTRAIFLSAGGKGLAWIVAIPNENHAGSFEALSAYLEKEHGLKVDHRSKDLTRLRFLRHDPDAFINENSEMFTDVAEGVKETAPVDQLGDGLQWLAALPNREDREKAEGFISQIIASGTDITEDYKRWVDIGYALANFGEDGRQMFHDVSQFYSGYDFDEADDKFSYLLKTTRHNVGLGTFFKYCKDAGLSHEPLSELDKMFFAALIRSDNPPTKPVEILYFKDLPGMKYPLATEGNFSLLTGKAKSRKTALMLLFVAAALGKSGYINSELGNRRRVVYFDTEQSVYDAYQIHERLNALTEGEGMENLTVLSLRGFGPQERFNLVRHTLYNRNPQKDIGLVVLDGARDLITSINDEEQSSKLATALLTWTQETGAHIMTILHQNKGDGNARGHVGTELVNKAETVFSVEKKDDWSIVKPEFCRRREFPEFQISMNEKGVPFIQLEQKASPTDELKEIFNRVFWESEKLGYTKTVSELMSTHRLTRDSARKAIDKAAGAGIILRHGTTGKSVFYTLKKA